MPEQMTRLINSELEVVEQTFLGSREQWPRPGWVEEYSAAFVRLRELYDNIETEIERQDLPFRAQGELRTLQEHCLWLTRRIGREVFFRTQLSMERALRAQTDGTAYNVYLQIVEIQSLEGEFLRLTDTEIMEHLRSGQFELYRDLGAPLVPE